MATFDDNIDQAELDAALASKADVNHGHTVAGVTGLQAALDGKSAAGHGHPLGGLNDVTTAGATVGQALIFDGTAFSFATVDGGGAHTHTIADVTGLQAALDGKAASSHMHATSDVTGLDTALANKSDTTHSHALGDLSNVNLTGATDGQALVFNVGFNDWRPATVSSGGVTDHGALNGLGDDHAIYHTDARGDARYYTQAQVNTSLAGKANTSHSHGIADVTGLQAALDGKAATPNRVIVSANHNAVSEQRVGVRSSVASITVFAPTSPQNGDYFRVSDMDANAPTNNITVDLGAAGFDGAANEDFIIDQSGLAVGFIYDVNTWRVFD